MKIQNNVSVYEGITIEDEVFCGPSCVFTNVINPRSNIERKDEFKKTIIRKGASIEQMQQLYVATTLENIVLLRLVLRLQRMCLLML